MDSVQLGIIAGSFTILSKGIACVLVVGYVIASVVPTSADYLALSCGRVFVRIWTLFTHGLFVTKILEVRALPFPV